MRVVGLQELCEMPSGTIFSEFDPNIVQGLYRRGKALETHESNRAYYGGQFADFFYHDLIASPDDNKMAADPKEQTFCPIENGGRWGKFEPDELFVAYEPKDIEAIVGFLTGTVKVEGE